MAENEKKTDDRQEQEEEEEEEMEKIEKFYSLIRHFREARNRLIGLRKTRPNHEVGDEVEQEKMKTSKKRKKTGDDDRDHERRLSTWVPSFECEDFTNKEVEYPGTCLSFPALPCNTSGNTSNNGKEKVEDDDASECLDLRLAL
ncbi:putative NPR1/NH1-interacting protein [Rosa chinensis]|uniref:Putative NPR1/NH1-interacting protein n=1 Tax=Rosa chinensis TaxID=74649 RepID=A0A2P6RFB9_ROSCH|nr:protein NIM1-INTERACTING 1 [Rosa chinensis]PRQ45129.1 putative NPR1/NH1-interacting protein [Rosa chinensis]